MTSHLYLIRFNENSNDRICRTCKKCLILANNIKAINNCYDELIKNVENISYSELLEKLDTLKFCDIRLINHDCHLNALNIQSLHNCINNKI